MDQWRVQIEDDDEEEFVVAVCVWIDFVQVAPVDSNTYVRLYYCLYGRMVDKTQDGKMQEQQYKQKLYSHEDYM